MRVAYSVPARWEYLRSGAPSEPILAEAAAQVMEKFNIPEWVSQYLAKGLISKGERGELVARLLLTLAHDRALKPNGGPAFKAPYSRPITVVAFLTALLGEENMMNSVLNTTASASPDTKIFSEAFEDRLRSVHAFCQRR